MKQSAAPGRPGLQDGRKAASRERSPWLRPGPRGEEGAGRGEPLAWPEQSGKGICRRKYRHMDGQMDEKLTAKRRKGCLSSRSVAHTS